MTGSQIQIGNVPLWWQLSNNSSTIAQEYCKARVLGTTFSVWEGFRAYIKLIFQGQYRSLKMAKLPNIDISSPFIIFHIIVVMSSEGVYTTFLHFLLCIFPFILNVDFEFYQNSHCPKGISIIFGHSLQLYSSYCLLSSTTMWSETF